MRRLLIATLIGAVLIVGAHAVWWRWAERQLAVEFANQVTAARASGCTVNAAATTAGGWPFAAALTVPDLFLSCHQSDSGIQGETESSDAMTWSTDRLVLRVGLLHPLTLGIDSEGSQHLRFGPGPDIPFRADQLHAVVPLQVNVPPRGFLLQAVNLRAGLPFHDMTDPTGADPAGLTIGGLNLRVSWTPAAQQNEAAVSISLNATSVQMPADHPWPSAAAIASMSADLDLNGPLPRLKGAASTWAAGWRDGGGHLEVRHLIVAWGALDASGNATLALDDQMQPMGAGVLHVTDPDGTLATLRESGMIGERAALAAKALLSLMAHPSADGGKPTVDLPVTLQNRLVSISRFGVARVPAIAWK